jgi:hypothetical protein
VLGAGCRESEGRLRVNTEWRPCFSSRASVLTVRYSSIAALGAKPLNADSASHGLAEGERQVAAAAAARSQARSDREARHATGRARLRNTMAANARSRSEALQRDGAVHASLLRRKVRDKGQPAGRWLVAPWGPLTPIRASSVRQLTRGPNGFLTGSKAPAAMQQPLHTILHARSRRTLSGPT